MILYSVTVNVDEEISAEWLEWMVKKHIPDVLETGMFVKHKIFKLLSKHADETGVTYNVQYFLENMDIFTEYQTYHAPYLQQEHAEKYGSRVVAFRTLLEEIPK